MLEGIRVRAYEPEDICAITNLFNQRSVAAGMLQIPFTTTTERRERDVPSKWIRILVAEIDGEVIGEGALTRYRLRRGHVGSIGMAVDESCQGRGVGTALMQALMDLADNWYNLRRVELQVYTDNAPAIHLYEKFGFTIEGTHRAYAFREGSYVDAFTMARVRSDVPVGSAGGEIR